MRLVLGVDGGGSKTHALVADDRGEVAGLPSSGRSNWEDTGLEALDLAGAPADPEVRARLVASSEGLAAPAAVQMSGLVPP